MSIKVVYDTTKGKRRICYCRILMDYPTVLRFNDFG